MTITHPNPKEPTVAENDAPQPKPTLAERYPEHIKLQAVAPQSQSIGEFVEWLRSEKNIQLMGWVEDDLDAEAEGDWLTVLQPIETLLAEFFDLDLKKIEAEKREMLTELSGG